MNEKHLAIYNEQFENCGECRYSEYLGCRKCETCQVEEYNKKVTSIYKKEHEKEQKLLEELFDQEDKSHIFKGDEKCVLNMSSKPYQNVLKIHEREKDNKYYPGIDDLIISSCYNCNRCGIWGK